MRIRCFPRPSAEGARLAPADCAGRGCPSLSRSTVSLEVAFDLSVLVRVSEATVAFNPSVTTTGTADGVGIASSRRGCAGAPSKGRISLRFVGESVRRSGEKQSPRLGVARFNGDGDLAGVLTGPWSGGLFTTPASMSPFE